ncbi:hypothetical protein AN958_04334 [Leucoagaricus sp. SymC.cos]|nr:hypothetical protein AN958_04334 [Leucoagaricus sp. SymC.cos]
MESSSPSESPSITTGTSTPIMTFIPPPNQRVIISHSRDYHTYIPVEGGRRYVILPRKGTSRAEMNALPRAPPTRNIINP